MPNSKTDRIFGVETEFGTLAMGADIENPEQAVERIKDYLFEELKLGALDLHTRDEVFEPARSGGFLKNGGRMYIDAVGSHLEYATPECRQLADLVATDRAGQRMVVRAVRDLGLADSVDVYNNSIDHFGGHTFGCHENYSVLAADDFYGAAMALLYPFLVTRQIFAGVGRVGGHVLSAEHFLPDMQDVIENPIDYIWVSSIYGVYPDPNVKFQLSQRADHILKTLASRVRFNRALVNPKWEQLYSHEGMTRLHLLFGESNQNEYAYALKIGTTSLVLSLIENGLAPEAMQLANPLRALRAVSRDPDYKWMVRLQNGEEIGAIQLQREYLEAAQAFARESEQTDWVLREWESILNGLERDPLSLGDRIDWVAKRSIVEEYRREFGLEWDDDALHSVDLEYHNIDPEKSLYAAFRQTYGAQTLVDELRIVEAATDPPQDTRAYARGKLVEHVVSKPTLRIYQFDWNSAVIDRNYFIDLSDPFFSYREHLGELKGL